MTKTSELTYDAVCALNEMRRWAIRQMHEAHAERSYDEAIAFAKTADKIADRLAAHRAAREEVRPGEAT